MVEKLRKEDENNNSNIEKRENNENKDLEFELPNKLKVKIANLNVPVTTVILTLGAGSNMDPLDFPGMAHFCEHMVHYGTEKYPNFGEMLEMTSNGEQQIGKEISCYEGSSRSFDSLPQEVIASVLKYADGSTIDHAKLINSTFHNIIQKYRLYRLWNATFCLTMDEDVIWVTVARRYRKKLDWKNGENQQVYQAVAEALDKANTVEQAFFENATINEQVVLEMLKRPIKIKYLSCIKCNITCSPMLFRKFLQKTRIEDLTIFYCNVERALVSDDVFIDIPLRLELFNEEDISDCTLLTDKILKTWNCDKYFPRISCCKTGITIPAILSLLQHKIQPTKDSELMKFGIVERQNTTDDKIERFLLYAGFQFDKGKEMGGKITYYNIFQSDPFCEIQLDIWND